MIFICDYCLKKKNTRYNKYETWDDLIDHLVNKHRFVTVNNKLVSPGRVFRETRKHKKEPVSNVRDSSIRTSLATTTRLC